MMKKIEAMKIGCIGCGTMGGAVVKAMVKIIKPENLFITTGHIEKAKKFSEETGVNVAESNLDLANKCDIIFLAVKPIYIKDVLKEIQPCFTQEKIIVSMAAGLNLLTLSNACKVSLLSAETGEYIQPQIIRIMPNLPVTYEQGMTGLCAAAEVKEETVSIIITLLNGSGKVEQVPEKLMDAVTAVSGSGPAYCFIFIEALADAAVRFGMPRKQAYIYAAQTLKGAATMALEDPRSISELKDAVCSPSGTTIEGVISLERHGFRSTVIEGATAAYNKSVEMGKK